MTGTTLLAAALAMTLASGPPPHKHLAQGEWGAPHVALEVSGDSARLEYDCAHGTVTGIAPDEQGKFEAKGTHAREHGGPVRRDEKDASEPAVYEGFLKDEDTLVLTVKLESGEEIGTFTLKRGQTPRLMKCR